jgi:glycosyltransferase involved in cell wall biosynthesis
MKILLVHRGIIPVFAYGGTERVIWNLAKALISLGHEVHFLVARGSTCPFAEVTEIDEAAPLEGQIMRIGADVVHYQFDPGFEPNYPYLVTEHGNSKLAKIFPRNTVFLCADHAQRYGATHYVYNGLDWSDYGSLSEDQVRSLAQTSSSFHFLGNGAWRVKNLKGAIEVALKSAVELDVLGANRLNIKRGFRFTWSRNIHFYGMVGGSAKHDRLARSRGLIFPVRWHEPFGLAVIESLYFGAPVFATPYGSLTELIGQEQGVLTNSSAQMVEAIMSRKFDSIACHRWAKNQFNHTTMARSYLHYYERVLSKDTLHAHGPVIRDNGHTLLEWTS